MLRSRGRHLQFSVVVLMQDLVPLAQPQSGPARSSRLSKSVVVRAPVELCRDLNGVLVTGARVHRAQS